MTVHTPIADQDKKLDIIDHIHQDHADELRAMAQYYSAKENMESAEILDIYHEGVLVGIAVGGKAERMFIAFELTGDLEESILYLSYTAAVKQKKGLGAGKKNFFEVVGKQTITRNFTRLLIQSQTPLPEYYPEYAYGFQLKILKKASVKPASGRTRMQGVFQHLFAQGFLWFIKKISSQKRKHIIESINKDIRLYTLRQSIKASASADFLNQGMIDIFTHDDSPGSQWVAALMPGDTILSRTEVAYNHDYLMQGKAVLIADETAYPALVGILENWRGELAPDVIILGADSDAQKYFDPELLQKNAKTYCITCAAAAQAEQAIAVLDTLEIVDTVWGALEQDAAKKIRHYLRNQRGLVGKKNHLKGYWRLK